MQAEELNLIIGNAFKMAYAQQRDRQPTFHELIEAQVAEQQAKFREIEKQAQVGQQHNNKKLKTIKPGRMRKMLLVLTVKQKLFAYKHTLTLP